MKFKFIQFLPIFLLSFGFGYSQVNTNGTVNPSITSENPFFDASSYFDSSIDPTSAGKGLLFPRTDLTTFTFKTDLMDGITFPTAFDGMIVYNTATGSTASGQGVVTTVSPGFYYFSNLTGTNSIDQGEWKRIGSAIDPVNVFVNDATNTLTYVAKKSDGITTRDAGTEFVIKDNGSVGVGTTTPNTNAVLELNSTTKAFLPPRMTTAQISAISAPTAGMVIFNTTVECLQVYKNNSWECIGAVLNKQNSFLSPSYTGVEILGSAATTHYNGWVSNAYTGTATTVSHTTGEPFTNLTFCANKFISVSPCSTTELSAGITDLDGNNYPVVTINGQCWMSSNLKQRPYGSRANTGTTWLNFDLPDVGSWGYYLTSDLSGVSGWGTTEPAPGKGLLYQWSAVMNSSINERSKGICPIGFHVPSDCEWLYLEHGLGMPIADAVLNTTNLRGDLGHVMRKLKATSTINGNNASGFNGIYGGIRNGSGTFGGYGNIMEWYSSTSDNTSGLLFVIKRLNNDSPAETGDSRVSQNSKRGSSLRCLKD